MAEKLKVIDLLSGIGGRALGFERAGYDIVCAVDKSNLCRDIYAQITANRNFNLADIKNIDICNLPKADVITAKLIMHSLSMTRAGVDSRDISQNEIIFEIISHQRPMAFVVEVPTTMITKNRSMVFRSLLEGEVFRNYYITYRIIEEEEYSGFPMKGKQAYMIGIRTDLYYDEFYFPKGEFIERHIFQEDANEIDSWYRKKTFDVDLKLSRNKFYVRNGRKLTETDHIYWGFYRETYIFDEFGLRKLTHNECAYLKGLEGYNFNDCSNRREMYMRLAYASNVYVVKRIAEALKKFLERNIYVSESQEVQQKLEVIEHKKVKTSKNAQKDIMFPKQKLKRIHVDNLKGIKGLDILFNKNLTAIMGVNGAGKSTIIHALACVCKPYTSGEDYKFSFFFTPNPDSTWKNSKFSITYWDENFQREYTREYRKNADRWAPRYVDRPQRDVYFIGIETCVPEIERERQTSYIDYKTSAEDGKNVDKIIRSASYILNKNYDQLNSHKTKKKELLGVHTKDDMRYSALSMGAGEQRIFRILKTIYTANTYSLILIDEIDLLLHVMALKRLISTLAKVAEQRNLQIIFTTHSMELSRLQQYVDIRYLHPLKEKTMVYDTITPDIVYEMNENIEQPIKIYVEDVLAETIVNEVAEDLEMLRNVKVIKLGVASNAFVVAASLILQKEDVNNILILLDGDVYRSENEKRSAIQRVLSGTEDWHEEKVDRALSLIHQFILPDKTAPEEFIYDMLVELKDNNEITMLAREEKAVADSHQWVEHLVTRMGKNKELMLSKIISMVSDHEKWAVYIKELREWLVEHK